MSYIPERGDLVFTNFDPSAGIELNGKHPAIVISKHAFNAIFNLALVIPISSTIRGHGFEVPVNGEKMSGVIICQNLRTIDYTQCQTVFIEKAEADTVKKTLNTVQVLLK